MEGEIPDLAEAVEERQGVDSLLVSEVDDAIEEVVLEDLEAGVELVRAEVDCGGGVEAVAAAGVAVYDGGAVQREGGLRGGLAGLDYDPEHRRADEAQRLAHPVDVVGEEWYGGEGETKERW